MNEYEIAIRLGVAIVCGAIVGYEREKRGHAAGLRTHILVALGSAAFALIGVLAADEFNANLVSGPPVDPTRIVSYIVGGIGFLCAGVIIHSRGRVRGLTTATGVWTVSAIGAASGMGYYWLTAMATVLAFVTLTILKRFELDVDIEGEEEN